MRWGVLCVGGLMAVGMSGCGDSVPQDIYDAPDITWDAKASELDEPQDKNLLRDCPPNGTAYDVWGGPPNPEVLDEEELLPPIYRDESSMCTAAVHAGQISLADGGRIKLRLIAGEASYKGSTFNGVTSLDYDNPGTASFEFP